MTDFAQKRSNEAAPALFPWLEKSRKKLSAIVAVIGLLALWQGIVWVFSVPTYMAPSPFEVLGAFGENASVLISNF